MDDGIALKNVMTHMTYTVPVNPMKCLLGHAVDVGFILDTELHKEVSHRQIDDILARAASFTENTLTPLNWDAYQSPPTLNDEQVTVSADFKEAYEDFVEAGGQGPYVSACLSSIS